MPKKIKALPITKKPPQKIPIDTVMGVGPSSGIQTNPNMTGGFIGMVEGIISILNNSKYFAAVMMLLLNLD
jgi:hypothetical protein